MPKRHDPLTLLDRLRRAPALRVVLVVAAMLASQNSLVCAFEEVLAAQTTEIVADESGEDCCSLCVDCAHCGGCHSSAVSPRAHFAHLSFSSFAYAKFTFATAAPERWAPPTLLRPPINAA